MRMKHIFYEAKINRGKNQKKGKMRENNGDNATSSENSNSLLVNLGLNPVP
jgi:hypothetical protein